MGTRSLLAITTGNVQDFISAARRTRDLWFGSFLISEISKVIAKIIAENGGTLIFPALEKGSDDLEPGHGPGAFNVSNIILAEIPEGTNPEEIKNQACNKAKNMLKNQVDDLPDSGAINQNLWDAQVDDLLHFYAAWLPLENEDDWASSRARLMQLLAARKATREFKQHQGKSHVPKCSLCGARESVLAQDNESMQKMMSSIAFRMKKGEQLCALGLLKRSAKGAFPSVSR
ncbi:MAG: type III-B CRISPR-associated protein Cas10/Cmr2, partial [Promethearchaeota archaeon]